MNYIVTLNVFDINFEKVSESNRFEVLKFLSGKCVQKEGDEQAMGLNKRLWVQISKQKTKTPSIFK